MKLLPSKFIWFISGALCLIHFTSHSQEYTIRGEIRDALTKDPLQFASIGIKGTSVGTISNSEGVYTLNIRMVAGQDSVEVSYMGYRTYKSTIDQLKEASTIEMQQAAINLPEFMVSSRDLSVREILDLVEDNYEKNYPELAVKEQVFYHKYETTPFNDAENFKLKKSNFVGLDRQTFDKLLKKIPNNFTEYYDALVELYVSDDESRLIPLEAISLEEGSMQNLSKEMEDLLGDFIHDVEKTNLDTETYYKFRTGIFSKKINKNEVDSSLTQDMNDSLHYNIPADYVKGSIKWVKKHWGSMEGKNWEFMEDFNKYDYELKDMTIFNNELVYPISFKANKKGLYNGTVYISAKTYAVLQMDFEFAPGKTSENFDLLGFGHSLKYKSGHVVFDRDQYGYYVKYIYANVRESATIDRDFSVSKKEKRLLWDKTVNEIKLSAEMNFNMDMYWEILVMDRKILTHAQVESVKQPKFVKFKKEYAFTPEMWQTGTVIMPSKELKAYARKE